MGSTTRGRTIETKEAQYLTQGAGVDQGQRPPDVLQSPVGDFSGPIEKPPLVAEASVAMIYVDWCRFELAEDDNCRSKTRSSRCAKSTANRNGRLPNSLAFLQGGVDRRGQEEGPVFIQNGRGCNSMKARMLRCSNEPQI
jgi:hypothetical protein